MGNRGAGVEVDAVVVIVAGVEVVGVRVAAAVECQDRRTTTGVGEGLSDGRKLEICPMIGGKVEVWVGLKGQGVETAVY